MDRIRSVEKSKYLGVIFNKQGTSKDEIQERVNKGRIVIRTLNSLLWERSITRNTKKHIYNSMVQSVILYGAEVWNVSNVNKKKLMAAEMDFFRRSCRRSKLDRVRNVTIRAKMNIDRTIICLLYTSRCV